MTAEPLVNPVPPPAPNPFARPVVDSPRDALVTAEDIHRAEFAQLLQRFGQLEAQTLPRLLPGPLATLVLSQTAGCGKSHLLARLWRALNGRATVVFLRAHQDRFGFWQRIRERLVQELESPDATAERGLQAGGLTQLDSLARHLLAELLIEAVRQRQITTTEKIERAVQQAHPGLLPQFRSQLPKVLGRLSPDKLVPGWIQKLAAAGLHLGRDPAAWLKVLAAYTLNPPGHLRRQLALAWVQGCELEPAEARELGLLPHQGRSTAPAGSPEESRNEEAFACLRDLCLLGCFFRPVVFAFDQTEIFAQSPELARVFGATLARLQAECVNQMTLLTANQQTWVHALSAHFEQADLHRLEPQPLAIKGIARAQAAELVALKLRHAGHPPDRISQFVAGAWLDALYPSHAAWPTAREVERAAGLALSQPTAPTAAPAPAPAADPSPDADPLAQAYEAHRLRLLAGGPRELAFDIGRLQWMLDSGLAELAGVRVIRGFRSARAYLNACWQSDTGRTLFWVLNDSNHWKRWQAIAADYLEHAGHEQALGHQVIGRVLWHSSLKPVGEGMKKQLELAAAQGLALVQLGDAQMAELLAGQALYADWCEGNVQRSPRPALLRFLAQRLAHWAAWLHDSPVPPPSPSPSPPAAPPSPIAPQPAPPPVQTHLPGIDPQPPAAPAEAPPAPSPHPAGTIGVGRQRGSDRVLGLSNSHILRHSAVLGGTGSGKTTAALHLVEQLLAQGVPVVLLDRKGDLCRYADPAAWQDNSWPPAHSTAAAQATAQRQALHARLAIRLYTPGAPQGRSLRLPLAPAGLASLPELERQQAARDSAAVFAQALGLGQTSEKAKAKNATLICAFQVLARRLGERGITLDDVLNLLDADDSELLDAMGRLDPRYARALLHDVQAFKISHGSLLDPHTPVLDWAELLRPDAQGRTPLTVVSTKFLGDDSSTLFWVAQFFLELLRHVSRAPSEQLQGLLMVDEADIYLPAQRNPVTKTPLEGLLKRARSGGVGLLLCTQSPGDLDYRGRDNIRNWLLGSLREARALEKLHGLLADARVAPEMLAKQKIGQFVFAAEGQATPLDTPPNLIQTRQLAELEILALAGRAG